MVLLGLEATLNLVVFFVIAVPIYTAPSLIAFQRKHKYKVALLALNILLGWTFIFWVFSLVWALMAEKEVDGEDSEVGSTKQCPFCAEKIKRHATVCRYCNRELEKNL